MQSSKAIANSGLALSIQFENTIYYVTNQVYIAKLDLSNGQQEIIAGVQGNSVGGDGGSAKNATIIVGNYLSVVAEKDETSGKLYDVIYLVDLYSTVRRIRMKTGIIDHIAGALISDINPNTPDVIPTSDIKFSTLNGLAVYPKILNNLEEANIIVLDRNILRRIQNDTVYRICGGIGIHMDAEYPAINSTLLSPYSISLNSRNEIFITEKGSNRFRKILQNGNIVTVYGNEYPVLPVSLSQCGYTEKEYNCPTYLTVYSVGELDYIYFSDDSYHLKRLILNSTDGSGKMEVIAGKPDKRDMDCKDGIVQAFDCPLVISSNFVITQEGRSVVMIDSKDIKVFDVETKMVTPLFGKGDQIFRMDGMKGITFPLSQPTGLSFNYHLNEKTNKLEKVLFISEAGYGAVRYYDLTTKTIRTLTPGFLNLESSTYIYAGLNYSISSKPMAFDVGVNEDTIDYFILNELSGISSDSVIKVSQNIYSNARQISLVIGNALKPANTARMPTYMNASSVMYNQPEGIVATDMGIFVSDTYNNNIKLIGNNNMVKVVVKNVKKPTGLAYFVTTFGVRYLIFAETGRHVIKKMNLETNTITILAGMPDRFGYDGNNNDATQALLNEPRGMTIVKLISYQQGLLFADSLNHRIRFINFNTTLNDTSIFPIISASGRGIPSNEKPYYNTPHDIHGCSGCSFFYVADTYNSRIKRLKFSETFDKEEFVDTIVAGDAQSGPGFTGDNGDPLMASLFHPYSVVYTSGITYFNPDKLKPYAIADTINSRIRLADNKIIKTIVGGSNDGKETEPSKGRSAKLKYPKALDYKDGAIYIADTSSNKIRKYSINDDLLTTISGGFGDNIMSDQSSAIPLSMARAKSGNIYIADNLNNIIRKIDGLTGIITTIAGTGDYGFSDNVPAISASLAFPSGIAVSPLTEDIFVSDSNNHRIRKISAKDGIISTVCGSGNIGFSGDNGLAANADLNSPTCIMLLPPTYEDFVFCDKNNGRLRRVYNFNGQRYIYSIVGNGTVDVVDIVANYLAESTFNTAVEVPISKPEGTAFVENTGRIFVSDSLNNVVKQLIPFCENNYVLNPEKTRCIPKCFDLTSVDSKVCSGNGMCLDSDTCSCTSQYSGNQCQHPVCFGISSSDLAVCSNSSGTCIKPDTCSCTYGYIGTDCRMVTCFGKSNPDACNGNLCIAPDTCQCSNSFGKECEHNSVLIGTIVGFSIFVLLLLSFSMLTMVIFFTKYRKQKKIIQMDQMLDERLLSQTDGGESVEFIDINNSENSSFIIPIEQLNMDKPIKRLGSGGVGAVFQTRWKNNIIAVKVFDMNNMNISEKDFQMEALILSKLRHPNIITFYGISSSPTKRFIAMECLEKSLDNLITQMQNQTVKYSLIQKMDILTNIANGILYLHTLSPTILHRDLKPANILIDRFGVCKLCDFGLSKMLSNYRTSVTSQIGTCYYLSPEMISSNSEILGEDARAIDIYSFSIIVWQVLFECSDPYMSRNQQVLQKLGLVEPANMESSYQLHKGICENNLRPVIPFTDLLECKEWCRKFDSLQDYEKFFHLTELIRQSWSPIPSVRPNIQEVVDRLEKIYNA